MSAVQHRDVSFSESLKDEEQHGETFRNLLDLLDYYDKLLDGSVSLGVDEPDLIVLQSDGYQKKIY